mmetsp:Transcript_32299/g.56700  ORF Transcript_32299/g.56700 Transcript_32299/m.56700 type:complete len:230 (+) Transcript_32299:697-1386(+)
MDMWQPKKVTMLGWSASCMSCTSLNRLCSAALLFLILKGICFTAICVPWSMLNPEYTTPYCPSPNTFPFLHRKPTFGNRTNNSPLAVLVLSPTFTSYMLSGLISTTVPVRFTRPFSSSMNTSSPFLILFWLSLYCWLAFCWASCCCSLATMLRSSSACALKYSECLLSSMLDIDRRTGFATSRLVSFSTSKLCECCRMCAPILLAGLSPPSPVILRALGPNDPTGDSAV